MDLFKRRFNTSPHSRNSKRDSGDVNSGAVQSRMFGVSLSELCERKAAGGVPAPLSVLVATLSRRALDLEGIFRVNGSARTIDNLRQEFDTYGDADLENCNDLYAIAGVLKLFLRELPDGLVPESYTAPFTAVAESANTRGPQASDSSGSTGSTNAATATPATLQAYSKLLENLPESNLRSLAFLCRFLHKVADPRNENKMNAVSLAICFGPNVFRCGTGLEGLRDQGLSNQIMAHFIEYYDTLLAPVFAPAAAVSTSADNPAVPMESNSTSNTPKKSGKSRGKPARKRRARDSASGSSRERVQRRERGGKMSHTRETALEVREAADSSSTESAAEPDEQLDKEPDSDEVTPAGVIRVKEREGPPARPPPPKLSEPAPAVSPPDSPRPKPRRSLAAATAPAEPRLQSRVSDEDFRASSPLQLQLNGHRTPTCNGFVSPRASVTAGVPSRALRGTIRQVVAVNLFGSVDEAEAVMEHLSNITPELDGEPVAPVRPQPSPRRSRRQHQVELVDLEVQGVVSGGRSGRRRGSGGAVPPLDLRELAAVNGTPAGNQGKPAQVDGVASGDTSSGQTAAAGSNAVRVATRRMQSAKRRLARLESEYERQFGWKPSQAERNSDPEMREAAKEVLKTRRLLKSAKEVSQGGAAEDDFSTESSTIIGGTTVGGAPSSDPRSTARDVTTPLPSGSHSLRPQKQDPSAAAVRSNVEQQLPNVEDTLDELMTRLLDKRRQAGRPESLASMTTEQVAEEKLSLQKALLFFEQIHGRPKTRYEKEVMKPLYDRYRSVKRLLVGGGSSTLPRNSPSRSTGGPVIHIPSTAAAYDWTGDSSTNSGGVPPPVAPVNQDLFLVTQDMGLLRQASTLPNRSQAHSHKPQPSSATGPRPLEEFSFAELLEEKSKVAADKKKLQKQIKLFEKAFEEETGRKVERDDRLPMGAEYSRYKQIKAKLKQLDDLIAQSTM